MNLKRFKALTTIEACMIMLFVVLLYIYHYQQDNHVLEKESYKTTARAAYEHLNEAAPISIKDKGFEGRFSSEEDIIKFLGEKIKTLKNCPSAHDEYCWSTNWLWPDHDKPGIQLKTMQYVVSDFISEDCSYSGNIPNTCAFIYVDTNGANGPNEIGKDILLFYMTRQGFIPAGTKEDIVTKGSDCDLDNNIYNWGCTAKLLGLN